MKYWLTDMASECKFMYQHAIVYQLQCDRVTESHTRARPNVASLNNVKGYPFYGLKSKLHYNALAFPLGI